MSTCLSIISPSVLSFLPITNIFLWILFKFYKHVYIGSEWFWIFKGQKYKFWQCYCSCLLTNILLLQSGGVLNIVCLFIYLFFFFFVSFLIFPLNHMLWALLELSQLGISCSSDHYRSYCCLSKICIQNLFCNSSTLLNLSIHKYFIQDTI